MIMLALRNPPMRGVRGLVRRLSIAVAAFMLGGGLAQAIELHGAGSTFIAPLMDGWINYFDQSQPDIVIRYDAIGSGQGVARFTSGAIDFGATDNYVPPAEAPGGERGTVELPSAAGMIVLAYNLPGLKGRLNLPRDVYVDIFRGKIRTWDDPRIVAANPGLKLPPISIATVVRQDSSGTTYAFTEHLASIDAEWAAKPGVGKTIEWPHLAMLARGNEGVASKIRNLARGDRLYRIQLCASLRISDGGSAE